mmetsp:Transcript_51827/g.110112  ORF Transcript_51827/g.110112 Transcript_51827/m.110112 type:complete len:127 (+) Transcript_51827:2411-2791(+)
MNKWHSTMLIWNCWDLLLQRQVVARKQQNNDCQGVAGYYRRRATFSSQPSSDYVSAVGGSEFLEGVLQGDATLLASPQAASTWDGTCHMLSSSASSSLRRLSGMCLLGCSSEHQVLQTMSLYFLRS